METIEIVVYLFVAIVVGFLLIAFIGGVKPEKFYEPIKRLFFEEEDISYDKLSSEELPKASYNVWKQCAFGVKELNRTVYVDKGEKINKSNFFAPLIKLNLCYTLQSKNMSCGQREDVVIVADEIVPPAVIKIRCNPETKELEIMKI